MGEGLNRIFKSEFLFRSDVFQWWLISDVVDCEGCGSSVSFSADVAFFGDGLSFSDLVGFLPGSYLHPVMDVEKLLSLDLE